MRRPGSVLGHVLASRAVRLLVSAALAGSVPMAAAQHQETAPNEQLARGVSADTGGGFAGRALAPVHGTRFGVRSVRNRGHHRVRHHRRASQHSSRLHPGYNTLAAVTPLGLEYLEYMNPGASGVQAAVSPAASQYTEPVQLRPDDHQPAYGTPAGDDALPPPAALAAPPTAVAAEPELRLVFRDGHQQSIRNYVLTGKTLIVLDHAAAGRLQRIPLADLDVPATEQAAEAAGLEFSPPAFSSETSTANDFRTRSAAVTPIAKF